MKGSDYQNHISKLARTLGVNVRIIPSYDGNSWFPAWRTVVLNRPPTNPRQYASALHELGHAALGHYGKNGMSDLTILRHEIAAWAWAVKHSAEPFTDEAWQWVNRCIGSYLPGSGIRTEEQLGELIVATAAGI